jgi:hypothetical protein
MAIPSKPAAVPAKKPAAAVPAKSSELDELNELAAVVKTGEEIMRNETGGQNSFIKLIQDPQAKELAEGKPEYIKGAKYKHFVIGNKKLNLGLKFDATVVGMFKLYEETEVKKENAKELPKIFGYWMPEDADNIPVDGIFDRPFIAKDGTQHVLRPVHWVALYIHRFPEITDAVLSFRSTGNSVYTQLAKLIKNNSEMASQLRLTVSSQAIENKTWDKTNLYPAFEIAGRNFDYVDGKIKLIKEEAGGLDVATIKDLLGRSAELAKEYQENKMVARKRDIAGLLGAPAANGAKAIGAPGKAQPASYREDDDDNSGGTRF